MTEAPTVSAILLGDKNFTDQMTDKKSLGGLFDQIVVSDGKLPIRPFFIYAKIYFARDDRMSIELFSGQLRLWTKSLILAAQEVAA